MNELRVFAGKDEVLAAGLDETIARWTEIRETEYALLRFWLKWRLVRHGLDVKPEYCAIIDKIRY